MSATTTKLEGLKKIAVAARALVEFARMTGREPTDAEWKGWRDARAAWQDEHCRQPGGMKSQGLAEAAINRTAAKHARQALQPAAAR